MPVNYLRRVKNLLSVETSGSLIVASYDFQTGRDFRNQSDDFLILWMRDLGEEAVMGAGPTVLKRQPWDQTPRASG